MNFNDFLEMSKKSEEDWFSWFQKIKKSILMILRSETLLDNKVTFSNTSDWNLVRQVKEQINWF